LCQLGFLFGGVYQRVSIQQAFRFTEVCQHIFIHALPQVLRNDTRSEIITRLLQISGSGPLLDIQSEIIVVHIRRGERIRQLFQGIGEQCFRGHFAGPFLIDIIIIEAIDT
jgi:hypothetical protein